MRPVSASTSAGAAEGVHPAHRGGSLGRIATQHHLLDGLPIAEEQARSPAAADAIRGDVVDVRPDQDVGDVGRRYVADSGTSAIGSREHVLSGTRHADERAHHEVGDELFPGGQVDVTLELADPGGSLRSAADGEVERGLDEAEPDVRAPDRLRDRCDPRDDGASGTVIPRGKPMGVDEVDEAIPCPRCGDQAGGSGRGIVAVQPPLGGAAQQERRTGRVGRSQVVAEELAHEPVQAEPKGVAGNSTDEQPPLLEDLEQPSAIRATSDGIGEVTAHLLEHGDVEQERAQLGRLLLEHLRRQVVHDRSIGAPEPDQRGRILRASERQGRQLDGDGPAFGEVDQMCDLIGAEPMSAHALDDLLGLGLGEPKVGGTRFHELAPQTQTVARDAGIRAAGDHEVDQRGRLADQSTEVLHRRPLEPVEVVEHDHDVIVDRLKFFEQGVDELVAEPRRRHSDSGLGALADLGPGGGERGDQASPEAEWVGIPLVDREPGCRAAEPSRCPLAQEHGLPVPGGRHDRRQPSARALVEDALEPGAPHGELGGVHRWEPCT